MLDTFSGETVTLSESVTLSAHGANQSHILQTFDVLRRRISRRLQGDDGFYPGFDQISLARIVDRQGHIVCTADVTAVTERMHTVSYRALHIDVPEEGAAAVTVLSKGHGRTFALPRGRG